MDNNSVITLIAAVATIVVALLGYLITYWNNIRLSQYIDILYFYNPMTFTFYKQAE